MNKKKERAPHIPSSGDGMKLVFSTEPIRPPELSTAAAKIVPLSDKKARFECGHESWIEFAADLYGERQITPKEEFIKSRKLCGECMLAEMLKPTIRCSRCGFIIMPGEGVALYEKNGREPPYAVFVDDRAMAPVPY